MSDMGLVIDGVRVTTPADLIPVYDRRFAEHGAHPRALLYDKFPEGHAFRVGIYANLVTRLLAGDPALRILDIGCGYGAMAEHVPPRNYLGVDLVPQLVAAARGRNPDHSFVCAEIDQVDVMADVALLVGCLGCVPDPSALLRQAWARCSRTLVVDFIAAGRAHGNPDSRRYSLDEMRAVLDELGPVDVLRRVYPAFDLFVVNACK
jgi:SAM-dependent methyltransferase